MGAKRNEILRLRHLVMDLLHEQGFNDTTVVNYLGVDPTGFDDEWETLPTRPCFPLGDDDEIDYSKLAVQLVVRNGIK